jgi:hypothetical protein
MKNPTVLVLGAGASVAFRFPAGWALLQMIVSDLRDHQSGVAKGLMKPLLECGYAEVYLKSFADALFRSGRVSIDAFLEARPDFMEVGKLAIAAALIPRENEEYLFSTDDAGGWLRYLSQFILRTRAEFERTKLSVVTFNYDRSFEYFLYYALRSGYALDRDQAAELTSRVEVVHVQGSLGAPDWSKSDGARPYTPNLTFQHSRPLRRRSVSSTRPIPTRALSTSEPGICLPEQRESSFSVSAITKRMSSGCDSNDVGYGAQRIRLGLHAAAR